MHCMVMCSRALLNAPIQFKIIVLPATSRNPCVCVCLFVYYYTHSLIRDRSLWDIYHQSYYYYKHNFKYNEIYDNNTYAQQIHLACTCKIYKHDLMRFMMTCQIDQQKVKCRHAIDFF